MRRKRKLSKLVVIACFGVVHVTEAKSTRQLIQMFVKCLTLAAKGDAKFMAKPKLDLSEIKYSELKGGTKGISITDDSLFLEVKKERKKWCLRLVDLYGEYTPLTGWVKLSEIGDLRRIRGKPIKDALEQWINVNNILERILAVIDEHEEAWSPKDVEEEAEPQFSEDVEGNIEVEVSRIVEAENQLEALKPHLDNVLVGEDKEKLAIFVLTMSGKYPEAEKKQMILLKGTSGGGKSTIQNGATIGLKVKDVGRFTEHALDYADLKGHEVLMLKELGGMDLEKQGLSTLKFLSSDDKGYTVEMPIKDPESGRFKNTVYRIPPITVISSTTRLTLDAQFERRTWLFNVDESKEQTENIALWKAKKKRQEYEKKLGYRKYTDYEFSREVVKRFVKGFEPANIIIPFPKTLTGILGYDVLRVRGDIDKVYSFLEFYGAFNKKRLEEIEGPTGKAYALTPEICVEALKMIVNPLTNMLGKMDERAKLILDTLVDLEEVIEEPLGGPLGEGEVFEKLNKYDKAGTEIGKKLRERIAVKVGKSDKTVRVFLNYLEASGFVSSTGGSGPTPKTFTLLYDVEQIKKRLLEITSKLESADNLIGEMQKEAQEWLKRLLEMKNPTVRYNFKKKGILNMPTTISDMTKKEKNYSTTEKPVSNKDLSRPQPSLAKTTEDNRQNMKRTTLPTNGNGVTPDVILTENLRREEKKTGLPAKIEVVQWHPCLICRKAGRTLGFNSKTDLQKHIEKQHGKKPPYVS